MKTILRIVLPAALAMALLFSPSCGEEKKGEIDDLFPPFVKWSSVKEGAIDIPADATFRIRFVEELDPASVDSSALFLQRRSDGFLLPAALSYDESQRTVSVVPDSPLERETFHDLVATESLRDIGGNKGREYKVGFDTTRPPTAISVFPADGATGVSLDTTVQATFSEAMDPATLTPSSFGLKDSGEDAVAASVSYDAESRRASFSPAAPLKESTTYRATISAVASDPAGNGLKSPYSWSFDTVPRYTLSNTTATWTSARSSCESNGGHLATIENATENDAILAISNGKTVWIGAHDRNREGTWEWVTGESWSYTNWYSGEPNNSGGEDCAHMYSLGGREAGYWNDSRCGGSLYFICEFGTVPNPLPVAYYPLTSDANDNSGNGNHGKAHNGVTFNSDGATFTGNQKIVFYKNIFGDRKLAQDFTVILNFKFSDISDNPRIFSLYRDEYRQGSYRSFQTYGQGGGEEILGVILSNEIRVIKNVIRTNTTYFMAVSHKLSDNQINVYLNDAKVLTSTNNGVKDDNLEDIYLGWDQNEHPLDDFKGSIKNFSIYNRCLTQQEIMALYNNNGVPID